MADNAGNQSQVSGSFSVESLVTAVQPSGVIANNNLVIKVFFSNLDPEIVPSLTKLNLDGAALTDCIAASTDVSCPVSGLAPGVHIISGSVSDTAGNSSPISGSFTVETGAPSASNRDYYFTWYDNLEADNWLLLANPGSAAGDVYYNLSVGGRPMDLSGYGGGRVAPGKSITPSFAGLMAGLVKASASGAGIVSERTLWPKGGSSLEEVLGTEENNLSSDFFWPWYDQLSPGYKNWVLVSNPGASTVYYQVTIAGKDPGPGSSGSIPPGKSIAPTFPAVMGGPVEVKAWSDKVGGSQPAKVMASQRVLSGGGSAFNEVPGIPESDLTGHYYWTWYDMNSPGALNWVLIANPGVNHNGNPQGPVTATIKIAGIQVWSGSIVPGKDITPIFPGTMGGPVEVTATGDIIATQRSTFGPSFEEVPGLAQGKLYSTWDWTWTWYDQKSPGAKNWVLIANPLQDQSGNRSAPIYYEIDIAGSPVKTGGPIAAGASAAQTFPGTMGGPVEVRTWTGSPSLAQGAPANSISSQRVLWNGYFNEVWGTS